MLKVMAVESNMPLFPRDDDEDRNKFIVNVKDFKIIEKV
jgi:hypothetical protein